jgi:hypothetical protein
MPVRINLKELFGSDSQEITIDKLNFNFNKLLELGVGLKGDRGLTGPEGPAGPIGPIGPKGDTGNYWFVGTGDPNSLSLDPADEDFYIDSDSSQIWQYDELSDTWSILIDLEGVVNDYLVVNGSPFVRGFGSSSPQDSRYITFTTRGGTIPDQLGDSKGSGSTNNDILFLNNFDESSSVLTIASDLSNTDESYTALQKIAVDITSGSTERYGLEIGSLYNLGSDIFLSNFNQSLKFHNRIEDISGAQVNIPSEGINNTGVETVSYGIISAAGHYNNSNQTADNDYLTILDLQTARRDAMSSVNSIFHTKVGSKFSLVQDASWVRYDGLMFETLTAQAGIGIAFDYEITGKSSNANYLMLDHGTAVDAVLLNNTTYQNNGDIVQLGTGDLTIGDAVVESGRGFSFNKQTYGNGSILNAGDLTYIIESISSDGSSEIVSGFGSSNKSRVYVVDSSNEDNILHIYSEPGKEAYGSSILTITQNYIYGWGTTDAALLGDHIALVSDTDSRTYIDPTSPPAGVTWGRVNLQIIKFTNDFGITNEFTKRGILIGDQDLESAYRVNSFGSNLLIATNRLKYWDNLGAVSDAPGSNYNDTGKLVLVNISDLDDPIKETVYEPSDRNHYLDMCKLSQNIFVVPSIKLGDPDVTDTYFEDCELRLNIARLENDSISVNSVQLTTISSIQRSNYEDSTVWSPFATVSAHEGWIYVAHRNTLYMCQYTEDGLSVVSTYSYDSDSDIRAMDSKLIGDSLYLLAGTGGTDHWSPTDSIIVKINVRDKSNPITISTTSTGEASSSKLDISGDVVYINKVNGVDNGYVIPVKLDGFHTDAAKIGSLVSSKANITRDIYVGESAHINSSLSVGEGGILTSGNASVFNLYTKGDTIVSETLTVENIPDGDIGTAGTNILVANSSGNVQKVTPESIVEESGAGVPCGVIVMWSGSSSSIPSGWYLCDGNNGTPDLTDRFIVGAGGDYSPGDTGGSNKVTLEESQCALPRHRHFVDQVSGTTGGSRARIDTQPNLTSNGDTLKRGNGGTVVQNDVSQQSDHTHTFTVPSHFTDNEDIEEAELPHENRPPYFALCFIMKCQGGSQTVIAQGPITTPPASVAS